MENKIRLYHNSKEYFNGVISKLEQAENSIYIESYIFSGFIGQKIIELLNKKHEEGLEIKLILDGIGSSNFRQEFSQCLFAHKIYHPLPNFLLSSPFSTKWLSTLNRRNHRKLILIDSQECFIGSLNISDETFLWQETAVYLPFCSPQLLQSVHSVWEQKPLHLKFHRSLPFLLNSSFSLRFKKQFYIRKKLKKAKKRIWILNAYFTPPTKILRLLKKKPIQNVDVRIIVPGPSDHPLLQFLSEYYTRYLELSNVKIYKHQKQFLHSKVMLIDNTLFIGSSNLNYRSIFHDLELDVELKGLPQIQKQVAHFEQLFQNSKLLATPKWSFSVFLKNSIARLLLIFKYWM